MATLAFTLDERFMAVDFPCNPYRAGTAFTTGVMA